jgi:hypothetical protein
MAQARLPEMTLTTTLFVLSLETGQVGLGLLCPEARYAAVLWTRATRIDRRFGEPADWVAIERELKDHSPSGPLPRELACVRVLAAATGVRVQRKGAQPVEIEGPEAAAGALDALLLKAGHLTEGVT